MKIRVIAIVTALMFIGTTSANAECLTGNCGVEINCATGQITYYDVPVNNNPPAPIIESIAPTHQVVIQTNNQSVGFSGTLDAVTAEVNRLAITPQEPLADACVAGGCNKVVVNATTGVTQVLPLTLEDLAQRYKDSQFNYQRQLELSNAAKQAVITDYIPYSPFQTATATATNLVIDPTPMVIANVDSTGALVVQKKSIKVKVRSKKGKKK